MSTEEDLEGWFYVDSKRERQGPFSVLDFKALADEGTIKHETLIWTGGYPSWVPAKELAGLVPEKAPTPSTPPPKKASALQPSPQEEERETNKPEPLPDEELKPRKGSFYFRYRIFGLLSSLFIGAVVGFGCFLAELSPLIGIGAFFLSAVFLFFAARAAYRKERYELNDSAVLCHRGSLVSDQSTEVEICNITHVVMKLPWLPHKLFGIGSLVIASAGSSQPVVLRSIREPKAVYERLITRMKRNGYQLEKEELLHEESPAIRGIFLDLSAIIAATLLALFFGSATIAGFHQTLAEEGLGWVVWVVFLLFSVVAVGYLVVHFLDMRKRTYRVFNDVVTYEEGFLTQVNAFIPSENIADAAVNRTFWDKLFNLYEVAVSCQGSSSEIKFSRLQNGVQLSGFIDQLVTEANQKPSPAELIAAQQSPNSDSNAHQIPTREEPDLVAPGEAWIADLKMHPIRTFLPLIVLLPIFPLWILAMIQAAIKLMGTSYTVREGAIGHSYRFLTTNDREFAYDKITGLVVKQNLWDRMLGTFTLRFWSIGSGQSLELAHVSRSMVDMDAILRQIGIPTTSDQVHEVPTQFGIGAWLRARCYRFFFASLVIAGLIITAIQTGENLLFVAAAVIPILGIIGFGYARAFYSRQTFSLQEHHIEATQGIITRHSYFTRYRNVKKNHVVQYPGGTEGSLQVFVAGEQIVGQQSKKKGQTKVTIPCSFTLGYLPKVIEQNRLFDDILSGRIEASPESVPLEPLPLITESKRGLGNSVFALICWSIILLPIALLLPLTLPLNIFAIKKWRYRVEAGRVVNSWGLLFKKQTSILLDRVDSLQQQQGPLNKMFKNGTISIMTAGSSKPDLIMPAAKSHQTVYQEIRKLSKKA